MVEYKVGQKIRVKSLEEIREFHIESWYNIPSDSRSFLERNAGKVRTIRKVCHAFGDEEDAEIYIEEDKDDFFIIGEIKPYSVISIPKEMFEI